MPQARALSVLVCASVLVAKSSWAKATIQALESTLLKAAAAGDGGGKAGAAGPLTVGGGGGGGGGSPAALASRAGGLLALTCVRRAGARVHAVFVRTCLAHATPALAVARRLLEGVGSGVHSLVLRTDRVPP